MLVLEHCFAVCAVFNTAYSDKGLPDKTTIHRLVTKFLCVFVRENSW